MKRLLGLVALLACVGCPGEAPGPAPGPPPLRPDAPTTTTTTTEPKATTTTTTDDDMSIPTTDGELIEEPTTTEPSTDPAPEPWDAYEPVNPGPPVPPVQPSAPPEIAREPENDGAISRFPGIRIYREEKRIEVDGVVCLKTGPALELMGCTRRGKTHESLLLFECEPEQLYLSLVILGLVPTPQVNEFGQPIALETGERLVLEVSWKAADSPEGDPSAPAAKDGRVRRRVEDLIWDRLRQGAMPHVGWVFTGSRHVEVPAPPDWKKTMKVFAATYAGNIAATFHDPDAILDTPLLEGGDDTVYLPYSERLPERGTEVIIHLRPFVDGQDGPPLGRTGDAPLAPGAPGAPGDIAPPNTTTPPGDSRSEPGE